MTSWLDDLFGITEIQESGVAKTFRTALDFADHAIEVLPTRLRIEVAGLRGVPLEDTAPALGDALVYDGTSWVPAARASLQWTQLTATTDFEVTAAGDNDITLNTDRRETVAPRVPLRAFMPESGTWYEGDVITEFAPLGMTSDQADQLGTVYFAAVDDGGGDYHVEVYSHTDLGASALLAHTEAYSVLGVKDLIADNDSGITGTVTVASAAEKLWDALHCWAYGIAVAVDSDAIEWRGVALDTGTGALRELWYGRPEMLQQITYAYSGAWASATSDWLADTLAQHAKIPWGCAALVNAEYCSDAVAVTNGTIYATHGATAWHSAVTISSTPWFYGGLTPAGAQLVDYSEALEFVVTAGNAGNTGLSIQLTFIPLPLWYLAQAGGGS